MKWGADDCRTCRPEHSFAVCAYGDSPYLERCLRSLKAQTAPSELLICTSTPSPFIAGLAEKYGIPLHVRDGASGIGADWNFAFDMARGRFVTLAHQDDMYEKHYAARLLSAAERWPDMTLFTTASATVKNGAVQPDRAPEIVKKLLRIPLRFRCLADRTAVKRLVLRMESGHLSILRLPEGRLRGKPLFPEAQVYSGLGIPVDPCRGEGPVDL